MKKILQTIIFVLMLYGVAWAVEDPSTFTIGGTDAAFLSATSTRMTASSSMQDNDNAYGIKDYGANYFGAFDIQGTIRPATTGSSSLAAWICFSNSSNVDMGGMNTADSGVCVRFKRVGTDGWTIKNFDGNANTVSTDIAGANDTTRYIKFTRSGTTCTLNVYTDSGYTTHDTGSPQTLTCSDSASTKYRYLYLFASGGSEGSFSSRSDGYIENVTINQADTGGGGARRMGVYFD